LNERFERLASEKELLDNSFSSINEANKQAENEIAIKDAEISRQFELLKAYDVEKEQSLYIENDAIAEKDEEIYNQSLKISNLITTHEAEIEHISGSVKYLFIHSRLINIKKI
jgi:hypothetical protein